MKFLILTVIFIIACAFSIFSSYMFFIPYNFFSFLIIIILALSNNTQSSSKSNNKLYLVAFFGGFLLDSLQHNTIFYNAIIFSFIVFLNDFLKNMFGSKFVYIFLLFIAIYDNLVFKIPVFTSLLNLFLLLVFYHITKRLLQINYAKKD
ncbi:MAG: hypothetical protein ACPLW6_02255 [Desulfurella sp.]|jgi:hypothetical protein|uniref:Uncharacterized protein n=1 Tax=Desulfurella multipotens TaxID=79269 RepID=A0A1G6NZ47_9BACT|nr:hypothetical protein [Desulfurella multipotens]AHF97699.1 hypothetical protein DESACE_01055 [Desulfurella acetivorans A63]PMP69025.1 MAG: hypothetical protein C0192_00825 [Desulfurella multipotens]PMP88559.1 MAG: hypothetical protein C0173_06940 [Desulfurella sp.]SDC73213.1 hypothetical protein SAMN05660835_01280 [Desulfurella multipotens]